MKLFPLFLLALLGVTVFPSVRSATASQNDSQGTAQDNASLYSADFSTLKQGDVVQVAQIIDGITFQLQDGRFVRLSGVESPDYDHDQAGEYSLLARDILADMIGGEAVRLHVTKNDRSGRHNRMGMILAQVERFSDGAWVQGMLLQLGLVRVRTTQSNPDMAAAMYAIEDDARGKVNGLWAEERFAVKTPETIGDYISSVQIVQGRVHSTALKNNRVYINFGPNWRTDYTVTIAPEDKRAFSRAGMDPLQLRNKVIRTRGWVDSYNGPFIEIKHPGAIEIIGN